MLARTLHAFVFLSLAVASSGSVLGGNKDGRRRYQARIIRTSSTADGKAGAVSASSSSSRTAPFGPRAPEPPPPPRHSPTKEEAQIRQAAKAEAEVHQHEYEERLKAGELAMKKEEKEEAKKLGEAQRIEKARDADLKKRKDEVTGKKEAEEREKRTVEAEKAADHAKREAQQAEEARLQTERRKQGTQKEVTGSGAVQAVLEGATTGARAVAISAEGVAKAASVETNQKSAAGARGASGLLSEGASSSSVSASASASAAAASEGQQQQRQQVETGNQAEAGLNEAAYNKWMEKCLMAAEQIEQDIGTFDGAASVQAKALEALAKALRTEGLQVADVGQVPSTMLGAGDACTHTLRGAQLA